jgi:hypothetical protein
VKTTSLKLLTDLEDLILLNFNDGSQQELIDKLTSSFLAFSEYFYPLRTGRPFIDRLGASRKSFVASLFPALMQCTTLDPEYASLMINVPPGYGKTEAIIMFVAWCIAVFKDVTFIYCSYSKDLAMAKTGDMRDTIMLPQYRELFGIKLRADSKSKSHFKTNTGSEILGVGVDGTITGFHAGRTPNIKRFGGALIADDLHKPTESGSERALEVVANFWDSTFIRRDNNPGVTPIIYVGQRVHENDQAARLLNPKHSARKWKKIILQSIDSAGNALMPEMHTKEQLLDIKRVTPYIFAAQYQQSPVDPANTLFKKDDFVVLPTMPDNIESTFLTFDGAETTETINDASAVSFWGVYQIKHAGKETGILGLHCIDCEEFRVEPGDIEFEFMSFYAQCCLFHVKPHKIIIEKKSSGTYLLSILKKIPGLNPVGIDRPGGKGAKGKTDRFISMQGVVKNRQITFNTGGKHNKMCIDHMAKITANDSHKHDDICDTFYDAQKYALTGKIFTKKVNTKANSFKPISVNFRS